MTRKYRKAELVEIYDEAREAWEPRTPHDQKIESNGNHVGKQFTGAQFIAFINKPMKQLASGELEVVLTIPFEWKDEGYQLSNALCFPLSIDIQIWKVFDEAIKEDG